MPRRGPIPSPYCAELYESAAVAFIRGGQEANQSAKKNVSGLFPKYRIYIGELEDRMGPVEYRKNSQQRVSPVDGQKLLR